MLVSIIKLESIDIPDPVSPITTKKRSLFELTIVNCEHKSYFVGTRNIFCRDNKNYVQWR
jgi:hypothetical protein